jgi:hypothetical protein
MPTQPTFSGYAVLTSWTPAAKHCNESPPPTISQLDWEGVFETVAEALIYARTWHDGEGVSIVRVTATVEPVASVVWPEQPEEREVAVVRDQERLLFP